MFILTYFLRGLQGKKQKIKLVLGEARDYITEAENHCKHKHVIFSLRGRFKGETSESFHFLPVTTKTDWGLIIGSWLKRSLNFKERKWGTKGFLFIDGQGRRIKVKGLESFILERITRVQSSFQEFIRDSGIMYSEKKHTQRF